jgi:hypothetical protein
MLSSSGLMTVSRFSVKNVQGIAVVLALCFSQIIVSAQRDPNRDRERAAYTRLEPGMTISVRTNEPIDANRTDYRVYTGIVAQDVRGRDGRVAIPRGSTVELMVRGSRNNELVLDMESVNVNGQRYAVRTDPNQVVGTAGSDSIIGAIVGGISGGRVRGRDVRIPRDQVMTFRLQRPLDVGVTDQGVTRDGHHYHDYYGRGR